MIPPGFVQELLSRVDIAQVIGAHVELKRSGASLVGLCPFHAEKSPSFSVNPARQFYHCFGCGAGGDAIRFLVEHTGMSFVEAVEALAQQAGLQVPREQVSAEERERRQRLVDRRRTIHELLDTAARFFRQQLRDSAIAVAYLKQRGLSGEIAARFGIGWAPEGWRALAGVFPQYDDPLLEESGLVRCHADDDGQTKRYDAFRARIMFPIRAVSGEVIGFGGRVLDDSKPKYINSSDTPVFSKGRELYGLFEARQAIREQGYALVVEGYMDVVALAQSGLGNAVATLGTACTPEHVHKLFRFTDSIVFAFDGDAAGRLAAARALEAALPEATDLRSVRFLFLPNEHDPDSFVREMGPQAFARAVDGAVPLSRQLLELAREGADLGSAEGRARLIAQARPLWQQMADSALKRQVLGEIAKAAGLGGDELARAWRSAERRRNAAWSAPSPAQHPLAGGTRPAPAAAADLALRLLLRNAQWWERLAAEDHQLLHGLAGIHGEAIAWLEQQITEHGPVTWPALEQLLGDHPLRAAARAWVHAGSIDESNTFEELHNVVVRLRIEQLREEAQQVARTPVTERSQLERLRQLHEQIKQLHASLSATG